MKLIEGGVLIEFKDIIRIQRQEFYRLKYLDRSLPNMSQCELAKKTGLQPSAISHFEAGRRTPSLQNLIKLCNGLEVTPNYLLGFDE